jgi:hypothetical protein
LEIALSPRGLRVNIDKKREAWYGDPELPKEIRRKPCRRMTDLADLSIYQHPERRLDSTRRYTAAYDVYSYVLLNPPSLVLPIPIFPTFHATLPSPNLSSKRSPNKRPRLGCVLLEIGLWQTLESFDKNYPPLQFQSVLLGLTGELVGQMGSKYAAAVRECLTITSTGGKVGSDREACRTLCWKVAAALDSCSA